MHGPTNVKIDMAISIATCYGLDDRSSYAGGDKRLCLLRTRPPPPTAKTALSTMGAGHLLRHKTEGGGGGEVLLA